MRNSLTLALLLPCVVALGVPNAVAAGGSNVLFIAIDDLNDWIGCLGGHPQVQTPHMDALAKRGVNFTEAHCTAPVCGPSRTAIMSGLRPWTTGVYSNNADYSRRLPDTESMPQYLRRHGCYVLGAGKLFHGTNKHPRGSFDEYAPAAGKPFPKEAILSSRQTPTFEFRYQDKLIVFPRNGMPADRTWRDPHTFDWGPLDLPDNEFQDSHSVNWAIERLARDHDKQFFLGVGFHLPHQPLYAPKRFHDRYPPASVQLPPVIGNDLEDLSAAGRDYALIPTTSGRHSSVVKYGQWQDAVSSYLATVSFVDHMLGQLMEALDASSHAENTWIVLWSDHGWHLGEKEHWGKATGWYRSTRVPFMIVPPASGPPDGFTPGPECDRPVNLIDLFPTVVAMAGLPDKEGLEGRNLLPLVADPDAPWDDHTITTFGRGCHAVSTQRWRYVQYFDGSADRVYLDDQHCGHTIHGNLFERCSRAVFIGGGDDNVVTNNVFLDCWQAAHIDNRGMGWQKQATDDPNGTLRTRLRAMPIESDLWKRRYPTLVSILDDEPNVPKRNVFARNISAGGSWDDIHAGTRKYQAVEDNLVYDDLNAVQFVKQENGRPVELRFKDAAAVAAIGFEPIPVERIGVYDDPRRASWPVHHRVDPISLSHD